MLATLGKHGLIRGGGRAEAGFHIQGIHAPLAFVQPVLISGELNHFDRRKPFRRIGSRIAEWHQLAHGHQNLNVMFREAEQFRRRRDI